MYVYARVSFLSLHAGRTLSGKGWPRVSVYLMSNGYAKQNLSSGKFRLLADLAVK